MENYFYIEDGVITNVIIWDGIKELNVDTNVILVPVRESSAWIGWNYDGEKFYIPE